MPIDPCRGYKKEKCWIPRKTISPYCNQCDYLRHLDEMKELLHRIECDMTMTDFELQEIIYSQTIEIVLKTILPSHFFDKLLLALLRRASKRPQVYEIIKSFYIYLRESPSFNSNLLLRLRNHKQEHHMCPFYAWLLYNDLFEDNIIPLNCLTCFAHSLTYCRKESDLKQREITRIIFFTDMSIDPGQKTFTALLAHAWKYTRHEVRTLFNAVFESNLTYEYKMRLFGFLKFLLTRIDKTFEQSPEAAFFHPLMFSQDISLNDVTLLWEKHKPMFKTRFQPHKEELIAKAWHTERMFAWCLDDEEKKEWSQDEIWGSAEGDGPQTPLTPGKPNPSKWQLDWKIGFIMPANSN